MRNRFIVVLISALLSIPSVGGATELTYKFKKYVPGVKAPEIAPCTLPWGGSLATADVVTAYATPSVAWGSDCATVAESRTCTNGVLSGTFENPSCEVLAPSVCTTPWGSGLDSGQAIAAYSASSVPAGVSCATVAESRSCTNGVLSGSYTNQTCAVGCSTPWSSPLNSGDSIVAYSATSVAFGTLCATVEETRTCTDGVLSGSFVNQACTPAAPANCTLPWGGSLASGSPVTAYQTSEVPAGVACSTVAETRTCTNGVLSGNFINPTCSVAAPVAVTWSLADKVGGVTYSSGNLVTEMGGSTLVRATVGKSSGQWYWEVTAYGGATTQGLAAGVASGSASPTGYPGIDGQGRGVLSGGNTQGYSCRNGCQGMYLWAGFTSTSVLGFALNADAGTLNFYVNGVFKQALSVPSGVMYPAVGGAIWGRYTANFGAVSFAYPPPAGYSKLQ